LVIELAGRVIEARISTLPTEGGERIVLRLVEGARSIPGFVSLGFSDEVASGLAQLLTRPQGLLFVTGPVGSGKSTTLYAILSHIYQTRGDNTTIVTLEDPIELRLPFAAQTQINARTKMTFANGLRSALRQDPNVLMVGEIRDRETADIAMQASLTGHLLLTTVHADDATGPFARMIDMGIEPFLLASSVAGCLSQRLVRRLCPKCRRPATADAASLAKYRAAGFDITVDGYFDAVGCDVCEQQGFVGRIPSPNCLPSTPTFAPNSTTGVLRKSCGSALLPAE
jgi:general secretion pathway protein E